MCKGGEYQKTAGTTTTDRVCASHIAQCGETQYESKAATATSDRECSGAGSCLNGALVARTLRTQANQCGVCNDGYILTTTTTPPTCVAATCGSTAVVNSDQVRPPVAGPYTCHG